jgi:quinol monooxygenase YgiN/mannose-6-phosphate isomerase-like protein (cupin superfamily)
LVSAIAIAMSGSSKRPSLYPRTVARMSRVGRYAKFTAKPDQGDALAERMLGVAEGLRAIAGCELYVINRAAHDPQTIWVTEVWSSQEELDASLETEEAKASISEVLALVQEGSFERIDVTPLGGAGLPEPPAAGYTLRNLEEAEDAAAKYGYGEMGESRFVSDDLDAERTGVSHQRLNPGKRQMFAHRHHRAEEVYVVLSGSGRARVEDDIVDLRPLDAIRVAPEQTRQFEAGPDGLEYLVFSERAKGDAEIVRDWWTD